MRTVRQRVSQRAQVSIRPEGPTIENSGEQPHAGQAGRSSVPARTVDWTLAAAVVSTDPTTTAAARWASRRGSRRGRGSPASQEAPSAITVAGACVLTCSTWSAVASPARSNAWAARWKGRCRSPAACSSSSASNAGRPAFTRRRATPASTSTGQVAASSARSDATGRRTSASPARTSRKLGTRTAVDVNRTSAIISGPSLVPAEEKNESALSHVRRSGDRRPGTGQMLTARQASLGGPRAPRPT